MILKKFFFHYFNLFIVELENAMPEDTDLIVDVTEKADSAESLNKSKDFMDLSSNTEELKISANEMNTKMKAKKLTNKTKHDISINDISSSELSAKDVLCNTTTRNGYSKSITTKLSHNNDNENKIIMKDAVNGHEADETDTEEEKGLIQFIATITSIFIN
jgi:hypothetical protein